MSTQLDEPLAFGMPVDRPTRARDTIRRLALRLRLSAPRIVAICLLAALSAGLAVAGPLLLGRATDVVVGGITGPGIDQGRLTRYLAAATACYLVGSLSAFWAAHAITGVVQVAVGRLRGEVESKLHRLPLSFVDSQPRGDLLSRVTNDVDNVAQSLQQTLGQLLTSLLTMAGTVVVMLVVSPLLFGVIALTVPCTVLALRAIAASSQPDFSRQWEATGLVNSHVEEACSGHVEITAFGRESDVTARFQAVSGDLYGTALRAQVKSGLMQPVTMLTGNLTLVALAVVGGMRIAAGALTVGTVQTFLQYSRQLTMPMTHVASMMSVLQSGLASSQRVLDLLDWPEEADKPSAVTSPAVKGRVTFESVAFGYSPERPLLTDVTFTAEPGHTVAIVGPTGAGKTTLVNLLLRFYDVDGGRIALDGTDIRDLSRDDLRANIGMVLQDTWLFHGTIRENILYGDPQASEERFLEAAGASFVDRFVHALPDGYDTVVDEGGSGLSSGERQLITLARAFLADRTILVLDEATSSVDTRTELLVQHAMKALREDRTCFVIAHRLSTIRDAETILVMQDGRIVEQGDHGRLAEAGGAYAALLSAQYAGPAAEVT